MKRSLNNLHDHAVGTEYVKLFDDIKLEFHIVGGKFNKQCSNSHLKPSLESRFNDLTFMDCHRKISNSYS